PPPGPEESDHLRYLPRSESRRQGSGPARLRALEVLLAGRGDRVYREAQVLELRERGAGSDHALGLGPRLGEDLDIARDPQQAQRGARTGLRGAEHVTLAAQLEI